VAVLTKYAMEIFSIEVGGYFRTRDAAANRQTHRALGLSCRLRTVAFVVSDLFTIDPILLDGAR